MIQKLMRAGMIAGGLALATTSPVLADGHAVKTQNDLLNATLWAQSAVEFKANALQSYKLAKIMIEQALADKNWTAALEQTGDYQNKPPAIILDVDETVLDNGAYQGWLVASGKSYSSKTWAPFVDAAISTPVPGSLDFITWAASKGIEIFYVSNRKAPGEDGTRRNLKALGYPVNDKIDTVLLRKENGWTGKKEARRAHVAKDYRILMLLGDNLGDFTDENGSIEERIAIYEKHSDRWGTSWIAIGNPMYGSWESAAFGGNWRMPSEERRALKIKALTKWDGPK